MKTGIHPDYVVTQVTCSCGNTFTTRSTAKSGSLHADVCSACHPFYTGKQKIMDVGGRVDKFEKRFGKRVRPSANSSLPRRRPPSVPTWRGTAAADLMRCRPISERSHYG
jgi:large subunit ribosomal protein L31